MTRVILDMAMSLDGFAADRDGVSSIRSTRCAGPRASTNSSEGQARF